MKMKPKKSATLVCGDRSKKLLKRDYGRGVFDTVLLYMIHQSFYFSCASVTERFGE